jgi:hypothetical protein
MGSQTPASGLNSGNSLLRAYPFLFRKMGTRPSSPQHAPAAIDVDATPPRHRDAPGGARRAQRKQVAAALPVVIVVCSGVRPPRHAPVDWTLKGSSQSRV